MARQERVVEFAPELVLVKTAYAQEINNNISLAEWITKLEERESGRRTNIKVMDMGSYSYGCLQFKWKTFEWAVKRYGFRTEISEQDLFNCQLQKQTAMAMIRENYGNWRHWKNVSLAIGLPPR